jgi:hypothetical protein
VSGGSPRARQGLHEVLEAIRGLADGRYACVLDARGMVAETPPPEDGHLFALRQHLVEKRAVLLSIPGALADEASAPPDDAFADWQGDEFLLAVLNGRVALVVACADAEGLKEKSGDLLHVWADRVVRCDARYRMDARGRGFFFGRARLDVVVIGGASGSPGGAGR